MKRRADGTIKSPPTKVVKRSTVTTLNKALSSASKFAPPPATPPPTKWPSLRRRTTETNSTPKSTEDVTPFLRKAATLTLDEPTSPPPSTISLTKKTSSILETDDIITTVTRLPSGSSITKTFGLEKAPSSIKKVLSKTSKFSKGPSLNLFNAESYRSLSAIEPTINTTPYLPPGGLLEIVFSFDTTSSMYRCLTEVRSKIQDMIQRLQADIPGIRIAVYAHGDYCDAETKYVTQSINFGATVSELCNFVNQIEGTSGGDINECYELVMQKVRTELNWTPNSQRVLVMVGDANPHGKDYTYNGMKPGIDWKEELQFLKEMGVRIYGVYAGSYRISDDGFWKVISRETNGSLLQLNAFDKIFETLMAICYCEGNADILQDYQKEVEATAGTSGLGDIFGVLKGAVDARGADDTPVAAKTSKKSKDRPEVGVKEVTKASKKKIPTAAKIPPGASKLKTKAKKSATAIKKNTAKKTIKKKPGKPSTKKKSKATVRKEKKKTTTTQKKGTKKSTNKRRGKINTAKPKATKTSGKSRKTTKTKSSKGKKVKVVKKKYRENTQLDLKRNPLLPLKHLECSGWKLALTPSIKQRLWKKRPNGPGMRRIGLFKKDTNLKSIIEFAVALPDRVTKYGVYFRLSEGYKTNKNWDVFHLSHPSIRREVDDILSRGGRLFARRFLFTDKAYKNLKTNSLKVNNVMRFLPDNYDYAWRKSPREVNTQHRDVTRHGFVISHSDF